jgi:hypothetical protein
MKGFTEKLVFLVSHLDVSTNPQELIDAVNALFNERKLNNQVVYFTNLKMDKKFFSNTLYQIAASMSQSFV